MTNKWQKILESDAYLLRSLDQEKRYLNFVETNRNKIREASFLDGRFQDFGRKEILSVPMNFALDWYQSRSPEQYEQYKCRLIFHVSFCGSTLLSRALESESSLTYKEPQALTDFDSENNIMRNNGDSLAHRQSRLALVVSQFSKTDDHVRFIVKPSNLINSIAPDICSLDQNHRAVFLSMKPKGFLIAVLRGGMDRVDYINRINDSFASYFPGYLRFQQQLSADSPDEMQKVCRSILLAHAAQELIFKDAELLMKQGNFYRMDFEQLSAQPLAQLQAASIALDLNLSERQLADNIVSTFSRHSKSQSLAYDANEASAIDAKVLARYKPSIDLALGWYSEQNFKLLF